MTEMTTKPKADDPERAHLADVEDGCGCTEIWEHMSEARDEADD
ncbi:hypothetical protein SAMN05443574_102199 [Haloarcula vallismortis]|uniref:Uncharacterized protein n=2 Tax=Haloarcula vallismortis TaxID=28442 RepID=M0JPC9_HALVA|nr:hypothetical protein [Haloarcula vallismortis]EMA10982.1 hypothetical protein C437_03082 [Haloarcula vallismortis ATCC 29715]SDW26861.1 hypothetical protein SAMN05443574_102199 [Haloarcula vallismortis]